MKIKSNMCVIAVICGLFAANACNAGSFSMQVQNKCDDPVAYKVESKGSSLQSSLGSRSSATLSVDEGDKIIVNGTTIVTVSAASKDTTAVLCNK
jgi:hypothetical protein